MASATSKLAPVKVSEKQGISSKKSVQRYYKTEVTTLADGSVKRETFRSDANGNNAVKVQEVTADKNGNITDTVLSTATEGEKNALQNPDSQLRQSIKGQTKDAGDRARANSVDPGGDKVVDKVGGGSGNNANNDGNTGDNSQAASQPQQNQGAGGDKTRNKFPKNLIYPLDIGQSGQDTIKFNMVKYEAKKFSGLGFADRSDALTRSIGSVILPVTNNISDSNAVSWGSDNLNPLQVAAAQATLGFIGGGTEGATAAAESIAGAVAGGRADVKTALTAAFAGQATGVRSLLTRTTGAIINPNMELLFQAPTLRPFNFSFKLSPRSADEAKQVIKIIRFFKQGMSPITTPSNIFLKSPHTFKIQYQLRGDIDHPYIGKIKECALTGFSVQYTPDGNYATFEDGVMTSYQISMTFRT